jgi:hypothetical protein
MLSTPRFRSAVVLVLSLFLPAVARGQAPLHEQIDQALAATHPEFAKQAATPASDEEFLRRVHLDLVGSIPTASETRAFLADKASNKREALIDRLLASPEHARHMAHVFDIMLMERRPPKNVPQAQWHEYLRASFAANKPWDQLVRELLGADGVDPNQRAAAKFYLDRDAEPNLLTRDVSRLFLGMNLQCAQCHDHPRIDDYKQDHYYGLFAFFNRTVLYTDKAKKVSSLGEKADGEAMFQSVFDPAKVTKTTGPRVPFGMLVTEPKFEKGQEYEAPPTNGARPVPKFSRRAQLGAQLARPETTAFSRNLANRLWAQLMGRGIIHPLDMDHSGNPPVYPALLDLLTRDIAARKYDIRGFLREIALTQAYQRSSQLPPGVKEGSERAFGVALLKPQSPEQLAFALMQATGHTDAERLALGAKGDEAALYARLSATLPAFVATFGGSPGTPQNFEPTLDQALFLANGAQVRGWLAPRAGNLMDRLGKLPDSGAVAEELYLSVLTRRPANDEVQEVQRYLARAGKGRMTALQEIAWAMLASAEFRFNH